MLTGDITPRGTSAASDGNHRFLVCIHLVILDAILVGSATHAMYHDGGYRCHTLDQNFFGPFTSSSVNFLTLRNRTSVRFIDSDS